MVGIDYFTKWVEASHYLILEIWMQRSLYGTILSLGLGFLTPSSQIMGSSLTVKPSGDTIVNWALETDI